METIEYMLTTIDNPYNPFTNFDEWLMYDNAKGYHTCEYLARIAKTSDGLSDLDYQEAVNEAIDEILANNFQGLYRKIRKEDKVLKLNEMIDENESDKLD